MDKQREEELLMHVTAGTDLLTAFAALPRDNESPNEPQLAMSKATPGRLIWAVLIFLAIVTAWRVIQ